MHVSPGFPYIVCWYSFLTISYFNCLDNVIMNKKFTNFKKQDLLDKLTELANLLYIGRRVDPNSRRIKNQLEAIQLEIESRRNLSQPPFPKGDPSA